LEGLGVGGKMMLEWILEK